MRKTVLGGVLCGLCVLVNAALRAEESEPLVLRDGEKPVVVYNTAFVPSPDPQQPWFGRSGFLHPFMTPSGRVVTDAFPEDHRHQHALMFAWTRSSYDGRLVDFWNSRKQEGRVEHVETLAQSPDAIEVALQHVATHEGTDTVVLRETWQVRRLPHPSMHVIDLVSTEDSPVNGTAASIARLTSGL